MATCNGGANVARQLKTWTGAIGESSANCNPASGAMQGDQCRTDVSDCVPAHLRKYQGTLRSGGANCWNLALMMKGLLPAFRTVEDDEFAFYMRPPLCDKVPADKSPQPGDIGSLQWDGKHIHAFMYISENLGYSKNDAGPMSPFEVVPLRKDLRNRGVGLPNGSTLTYFHCKTLKEWTDANPGLDKKLLAKLNEIGEAEQCLAGEFDRPGDLPDSTLNTVKDVSKALAVHLQQESRRPQSDENRVLLDALRFRLHGISQQLERLG